MKGTESYDRAALLLPGALRAEALFQPEEYRRMAEELRLRCGLGAWLCLPGQTVRFRAPVGRDEIEETLERATKSSFYTAEESLRSGYFTAEGGFRLGLGGSLLLREGQPAGFRSVSSISIRIPHAVSCVKDELLSRLEGKSVLIYSPPGGGKTTFLRDLVRRISDSGQRVSLVDERKELVLYSNGSQERLVNAMYYETRPMFKYSQQISNMLCKGHPFWKFKRIDMQREPGERAW